jgi:hypothetical protein
VGGSVSCWVSDARNVIPDHLAPEASPTWPVKAALKALSTIIEGCRRSRVTGQQYWDGAARLSV